jgi:hypothetical protein
MEIAYDTDEATESPCNELFQSDVLEASSKSRLQDLLQSLQSTKPMPWIWSNAHGNHVLGLQKMYENASHPDWGLIRKRWGYISHRDYVRSLMLAGDRVKAPLTVS